MENVIIPIKDRPLAGDPNELTWYKERLLDVEATLDNLGAPKHMQNKGSITQVELYPCGRLLALVKPESLQ